MSKDFAMQMSIDDFPTTFDAVQLKQTVLDLIGLNPRVDEHRALIVQAVLRAGTECEVFSSNDVRAHLPAWVNTPAMGHTFALLRRRNLIEVVGLEPSTKRNTHGKPVYTYRLTALGRSSTC